MRVRVEQAVVVDTDRPGAAPVRCHATTAIGVDIGVRRLPMVQVSGFVRAPAPLSMAAAAAAPTKEGEGEGEEKKKKKKRETKPKQKTRKRKRREPPRVVIRVDAAVLFDLVEGRRVHEYYHADPRACRMDVEPYRAGAQARVPPGKGFTFETATHIGIYRILADLVGGLDALFVDHGPGPVPVFIEEQSVSGTHSSNTAVSKTLVGVLQAADTARGLGWTRHVAHSSKKAGVLRDTPKQKRLRAEGGKDATTAPADYVERKETAVDVFMARLARDDPTGYRWMATLQTKGARLKHKVDDFCDAGLIAVARVEALLQSLPQEEEHDDDEAHPADATGDGTDGEDDARHDFPDYRD